ncbi:MAG: MATE family efflux transporter [Nitrospirae bacterium CG18_big_fil_WC_8_21_14_2_50_70_55]|nr:MATE family efflux transporter [Deltaproteobacteria bacterium]OIP61941.1 MAG: hypothetical protein AUK30_10985 [Nitrospirae bacterium CG2_30_70_394]PIQ06936.1 MAG: MATE family efflux transporter [Nitrospirae bacterium CG18_big_fil_WC_8_21_14_2_50_70_55]PIU79166.1 MAG: MATE family efflux transporter [Nitrospirae bacterium CG06_land_8_20_14_3_00_70_43]PIW82104.1 MAG: MATE family efflux transporter [Nitrospirae bacterium CG_4_8_14_3_um_filter_70_85]PIX82836.1 MAG: MATE family efflux transporte
MTASASGYRARLIHGGVGANLVALAIPMVVGLFAVIAFNLADVLFVARLGTAPLAAVGFTFPVALLVGSIGIGLGTGTASALARAIGEGNGQRVQRLATDAITLALLVALLLCIVGIATIDPLFRLLGAPDALLPRIHEYMEIWYLGAPFIVVPMVGNNAIRATGDARSPSAIMLFGAMVNCLLDPLLIFGLAGLPRLELKGAAIATVIARACTLLLALADLGLREHLLIRPAWSPALPSWRRILHVGLPASATNLLAPLSMAVIIAIAARFGPEVVAGVGAATRVEALALLAIMAVGASLVPFVGQNWGAGEQGRIRLAVRHSYRFSLAWGSAVWLLLLGGAPWVASLFSHDPKVAATLTHYLRLVPLGYGMQGVALLASSLFNALARPLISTALQAGRMIGLYLPLAFVGARIAGPDGLFAGITIANLAAGAIAWRAARAICDRDAPPPLPEQVGPEGAPPVGPVIGG